ncbi:glucan endo-1,3-beta-glucosidase-like [Andrographis paniculata]|uniref:glucan endo-1,3-beta-glucosidase-like n=1 Tax=Andrographis paniculata TaxID=175694 RepID=UPI0021E6E3B9|nr:glucan endo-1,3-beta-glucosidase-like [Andrographis paniculata]
MAVSFSHGGAAAAAAPALLLLLAAAMTTVNSIGVNYGTLGNNLPPPAQVAAFLKSKTTVDRIKIFDTNPDILHAFAGTDILVAVTVRNNEIPNLTTVRGARRWLAANVKPFYARTKINYVLVGNEILHWGPQTLIDNLVPAMRALHRALRQESMEMIKITTAHSLGILEPNEIPSATAFRAGWDRAVLAPMLQFHLDTKSPFTVNPYPFFGYGPDKAGLALFRPNRGFVDPFTKQIYDNMLDMQLDAVYSSMTKLGFPDVEIAIGETGWASLGESYEEPKCSVANAAAYNGGLVKKYESGKGTPLMPRRSFETYIFALFNENEKPGSAAERNFGLFQPNFSPVYDIGILRTGFAAPMMIKPAATSSKMWCVAKGEASNGALQKNIEYACSQSQVDCRPIRQGGACFIPNTVEAHASFAMNSYYQTSGRNNFNCDFSGTAILTSTNPRSLMSKRSFLDHAGHHNLVLIDDILAQPWKALVERRVSISVPIPVLKSRNRQKLTDKITSLQKLVSPYGKTDTASVLLEASISIKALQDQIKSKPQYGDIAEKAKQRKRQIDICNRCGIEGHWANTCRTTKHLGELYQASLQKKGKEVETNHVDNNDDPDDDLLDYDTTHLDIVNFLVDPANPQ